MDWKDILNSKIESGELTREDSEETLAVQPGKKKADVLHVIIDRKGRKGKTATIVEGFTCDETELKEIAARLKSRLGTGGSARGNEILIQGDRVEDTRRLLVEMGYKVK